MKTWNECLEEANVGDYPDRTTPTHEYIFYSKGEVVDRISLTNDNRGTIEKMRKEYPAHERVDLEDAEYNAAQAAWNARFANASKIWHAALREEYSDLPLITYNLCLDKAYEDGHSSGHDEVANRMVDYVDFAEKIMKAAAETK